MSVTMVLVLMACVAFAQQSHDDTTDQVKAPVKLSLLSNYYGQNGERSAVNGGKGSQELHSYTNEIYLTLPIKKRLAFRLNIGVDEFTSASYLEIDKYRTSASSGGSGVSVDETRNYGGIGVDLKTKKKNFTLSPYFGVSEEYDVSSKTYGLSGAHKNDSTGAIFTIKANVIVDKWMLIYPGEFRITDELDASSGASDKGTKISPNTTPIPLTAKTVLKDGRTYGVDNRLTTAITTNYAFYINKRMNGLLGIDGIVQQGLLSTPFYRVYFNDGIVHEYSKTARVENLPNQRTKLALYGRYNYFFNKKMILRTGARLYSDNWGVKAFSVNLAVPIKVLPWISVMPFYSFHTQSASNYFAGYGHHEVSEEFYTSDFDLANVYSNKWGASVRIISFNDFLNIKSFDLRYAHYRRSDGLKGNTISAELQFALKKKKNEK